MQKNLKVSKRNIHILYITLAVLLFTILISTFVYAPFTGQITIHFLDVGQADSIFIQLPNNQTILIDAGNNADGPLIVSYLKERKIEKIDYLIGTHPHEDHIGGLDNVILSFTIGQVYLPRITNNTRTYEEVLQAFKTKGKHIIPARAGLSIIDEDNLKAYFLSPVKDYYEEINHYSAVLQLIYGQNSFLFTGDAEEINEFEMLASSAIKPEADILKVAHHGSDSSSSEIFLKTVNPSNAVISVGKNNPYGHPSPPVLKRLQDAGAQIFRTDQMGTIIAISDGKKIQFNKKPLEYSQSEKSALFKVEISELNLREETVKIKNTGKEMVNLTGWKLLLPYL